MIQFDSPVVEPGQVVAVDAVAPAPTRLVLLDFASAEAAAQRHLVVIENVEFTLHEDKRRYLYRVILRNVSTAPQQYQLDGLEEDDVIIDGLTGNVLKRRLRDGSWRGSS